MARRRATNGSASVPLDDDVLDDVAEAAARESGAPRRLLGGYVAAAASCAARGTRLQEQALDECRELGELAAEEGIELPRLLDLYLSATWRLSERLAGVAGADAPASWATALVRASDDAAAALGAGYERAQRLAIRREEALRRELIDDLLAGIAVGEPLRELSQHLGFNLAGVHHAVVARTDRPLRDAGPVHAHVERELLAGRGESGFVATKEALLVCILPGSSTASGDAVLRLVRGVEPGRWVVGVGRPHAGAAGVGRSFREAREALATATRLGLTEPVVDFAALLPYRVLAQDQRLLRELVDDVLGPLEQARGGAAPLVETLEAYFDEALSTTATARRLHLSVRAVTYRLDRIAALTGRSLRDPRDRFALELAVRGGRLLGPADFRDQATTGGDIVRPGP